MIDLNLVCHGPESSAFRIVGKDALERGVDFTVEDLPPSRPLDCLARQGR